MYLSHPVSFSASIRSYTHTLPCSRLLIISPFITRDALDYLLDGLDAEVKVSIITTWKVEDILYGSSDIGVYEYCKAHKYNLYLNEKIHLKVICKDFETCIFGSANITKSGLALKDTYNYELFSEPVTIDKEAYIYFNQILYEADLVTESIYNWFVETLEKTPKVKPVIYERYSKELVDGEENYFISALPMSRTPQILYEQYRNNFKSTEKEVVECALHDIILYNVPDGLSEAEFYTHLKSKFFEQPFIVDLLEFIDEEKYFGAVKEWIQANCTDVPVPSRRDLTRNIQVLYLWICTLSEREYAVDRPKHSERIYRN